MTANKSIFDHTKVIYADEYANTYNPIWVYRMKFIMRALYYKRAFKHLANNIESSLLDMLCTRTHRFLENRFARTSSRITPLLIAPTWWLITTKRFQNCFLKRPLPRFTPIQKA